MRFAAHSRPIEGAVATIGVSDRVTFLRKTYAHLGISLIAFALIAGGMMKFATETSLRWSAWALGNGGLRWLLVLLAFMVIGIIAQRLAFSDTSRAVQYIGLVVGVVAQGFILQPLLWLVMAKVGVNDFMPIVTQSIVITLAIFVGLTLTVFLTKKDFSFMRGALIVCTFGALGTIVASLAFGFTLGSVFCGLMILLMSGYVLYQTSLVMRDFPPQAYVAAALFLFSTIATMFWYVLQLLSSLRGD